MAYQRTGRGKRVLLIMGRRPGDLIHRPDIPAVGSAAGDYSLADLVADSAGLIEALDVGPCRVVGTSLAGWIATELAVSRQSW